MTHALAARVLLVVFFVLIVGVRAFLQLRATRDHGLRVPALRDARVKRFADAFWVLVTIAFACGAALPLPLVVAPPPVAVGTLVAGGGIAGAFASQLAMGASWRIGLDDKERTALVTTGPYAIVRNPIYTCVLGFIAGLALLAPNALLLAAWPLALVGVELQVRLVEEPHLRAVHGDAYRAYAARVGRLVPLVGRIAPTLGR